jgi:Domain of unknown function (DUF4160)
VNLPNGHVMKAGAEAKLWLWPTVTVAYSVGFDARNLRQIVGLVEANRHVIERAWDEQFR